MAEPNPNRASEKAIHAAVLAGDAEAWRYWHDRHYDELARFLWWRTAGIRDLCEDVIQDSWLTAIKQIRQFDPVRGLFGAWLNGIAVKVLSNHLRKRSRNRVNVRIADLKDDIASSEHSQSALEDQEEVARTLEALPERQEMVLRAKYLDGLSVTEIATKWGESPKAIESLLSRARDAFRAKHSPQEDESHAAK